MELSYVYILRCSDGTYYTGVASNLEKRLVDHQMGEDPKSYTAKRRPVELVWYSEFSDITIAISKEKQIKNWSKFKKEALIAGRYSDLPNLAKKKFN
ncbi:GIY-YIG nuclease family protein [Christiangramia salexigens]|uniref:GIY-YIG domain-containing protein n=1 Tax=Christiangramia salexigens TaxID=1913577 RepID=A0A1L3J5L1_9FLAO|nr:GIY-YIG nuclease family protein [Christiangramia salexigens]APG60439.1 hypothetical protein LPB144_08485 [Christiangramia salexigens]